jgi:ZIP family zinc transporter
MFLNILEGVLIPFLGTTLGALCVFFLKNGVGAKTTKALNGFAGGVMVAASVWSLLIPAIDESAHLGVLSFIPAVVGFFGGIFFLFFLDKAIPHTHKNNQNEGPCSKMSKSVLTFLAITIHNIPEGAIISIPLRNEGKSRFKAFTWGALSGLVEPVAAITTILFLGANASAMPALLAFAAGAMLYVVVEELIPSSQAGKHSNIGTIGFAIGFVLMMLLDVVIG